VKIEQDAYLPRDQMADAWQMYTQAFALINTRAVQSHMMTWEAFSEVMDDERVQKWRAFDDDGAIAGLAVITDQLDAWTLASSDYFARRYPRLHAERRIWYVGFVCVRRSPRAHPDTFRELVDAMKEQIIAARGMGVMDFCAANVERGLVRATAAILTDGDERVRHQHLDSQEFHSWDWAGDER
jgi:hypothetical protein